MKLCLAKTRIKTGRITYLHNNRPFAFANVVMETGLSLRDKWWIFVQNRSNLRKTFFMSAESCVDLRLYASSSSDFLYFYLLQRSFWSVAHLSLKGVRMCPVRHCNKTFTFYIWFWIWSCCKILAKWSAEKIITFTDENNRNTCLVTTCVRICRDSIAARQEEKLHKSALGGPPGGKTPDRGCQGDRNRHTVVTH